MLDESENIPLYLYSYNEHIFLSNEAIPLRKGYGIIAHKKDLIDLIHWRDESDSTKLLSHMIEQYYLLSSSLHEQ